LRESTRFILPGIRFFNLLLKVRGPRVGDEQPHQQRRGDRETPLIEESDWNKTENQVGTPPEPDVLMKYVEGDDSNNQEEFFHGGQKVARPFSGCQAFAKVFTQRRKGRKEESLCRLCALREIIW
jgi:hypothetical protein